MTKLIPLIIFLISLSHAAHSAVAFEPDELSSTKSTWHKTSGDFKGEYSRDFTVSGNVVFRILERYVPAVESLISQAKNSHGLLRLAEPTIIYFDTPELIRNNFSVVNSRSGVALVDPHGITFAKRTTGMLKKKTQYFVSFCADDDEADIKVSKGVYRVLQLARQKGILQKAFLEIELDQLKDNATRGNAIATIVAAPDAGAQSLDVSACVICTEEQKNFIVRPCNHVCLCQKCSQSDKLKACPLCQGEIKGIEKVYF